MKFYKSLIIIISCVSSLALAGGAGGTANLEKGVILKGYDPVSYFKGGHPAKGKPELKAEIDGVTYLFSTTENKTEFMKSPKKYQPAYEGWCATAVASGSKSDIDPESFKVTDGRLFLFYKGWKGDAKKDWIKDESGSIKKADTNWPTVRETKD